jgi:hypothetical protein
MKSTKMLLGIMLIALVFTSCKDEKAEQAEKTVDSYVMYVDSLGNVSATDAKENWQGIEATYQIRSGEAEAALASMKDNAKIQERLDVATAKYEALKAKVEIEKEAETDAKQVATPVSNKQKLRNTLFGEGKVGDDMNFGWVNKDNILNVYDAFFQSYKDNKGNFSREDYDEIKLMYEALDSRKNTVEKEGLSSSDNTKIASIKFKFAPMFKMNRVGAKSREMEKAKE